MTQPIELLETNIHLVKYLLYIAFLFLRRNQCLNLYQNGLESKVTVTNLV